MTHYCEICDLHLSSELVMQAHVKGKKHVKFADQHRAQTQRAERSVYVRGFTSGTTCDQLRVYFAPYGSIESVYMEKEKGFYAFIEFSSRDSVATVLKRNGQHFLHHRRLQVRQKQVKRATSRRKRDGYKQVFRDAEQPIINHDELVSKLQKQETVGEQLTCLCEELGLNAEDHEQRLSIQDGLQEVFQAYIPACKVHQFGSSVNGFGIKGCDMDLFLDFNLDVENVKPNGTRALLTVASSSSSTLSSSAASRSPFFSEAGAALEQTAIVREPEENETAALPYIRDIKSLRVDRGKLNLESLCEAPPYDRLRLVSRILVHSGICSEELVIIPAIRCPVVRFVHQESGLKCDLSINNRLALRNTRLLQLLVKREPRLATLVYAIRYWAKLRAVAGNANTGPKLTNYALTMLVIAFLQQTEPPVLPPLEKLTQPEHMERMDIEGWDCTLPRDSDCITPTENKQTAEQLLKDFFVFYAQFDFANHVVCVRTASNEQLLTFRQKAVNDEKLSNFKFGSMCVQDPFVLDHNTALNINEKIKLLLQQELRDAANKWTKPEFAVKSGLRPWGLKVILSSQPVEPAHISATVTIPETPTSNLKCLQTASTFDYSFPVVFQPAKLKVTLFNERCTTAQHKWLWAQLISILYHQMLMYILLYDCKSKKVIKTPQVTAMMAMLRELKGGDAKVLIGFIEDYKKGVSSEKDGDANQTSSSSCDCSTDTTCNHQSHNSQVLSVDPCHKQDSNGSSSASADVRIGSKQLNENGENTKALGESTEDSSPVQTGSLQKGGSNEAIEASGSNGTSSSREIDACRCTNTDCSCRCRLCSNADVSATAGRSQSNCSEGSDTDICKCLLVDSHSTTSLPLVTDDETKTQTSGDTCGDCAMEIDGNLVNGGRRSGAGTKRPSNSPGGEPQKKKLMICDNSSASDVNRAQVPEISAIEKSEAENEQAMNVDCVTSANNFETELCSRNTSAFAVDDTNSSSRCIDDNKPGEISASDNTQTVSKPVNCPSVPAQSEAMIGCATSQSKHGSQKSETELDDSTAQSKQNGSTCDSSSNLGNDERELQGVKQDDSDVKDDVLLQLFCTTYYRMWAGRKKIRQQLRLSEGNSNNIALEQKITQSLKEVDGMKSEEAVLDFETCLTYHEEANQTTVVVHAQPGKGAKEFSAFYPFLKSFFIKLVDKTLYV